MEHTSENCRCEGKKCTKCEKVRCLGDYTKDKRLKSGLKSECRICARKANKKWRTNNKEYNTARQKAWNEAHVEHNRKIRKEYLEKNKDRLKEYRTRYSSENAERLRKNTLEYYYQHRDRQIHLKKVRRQNKDVKELEKKKWKEYSLKNREKLNLNSLKWGQNNRHRHAVSESMRRTRKRGNGGSYTVAEWEELKAKYNYACLCCGRREPEIHLHADHINPVALGGPSNIDNIQPLCKSCNSSKGKKFIDFRPQNT